MQDGRVTAVIPAWGAYADHRLDEAIASLRAQGEPLEILLVDNADDPPLHQPDVEVVRSDVRLALGGARNLGLEQVRTPLVLFWDADDVMPAGTLRAMLDAMERDAGLVVCASAITDGLTGERHHWPRRWTLAAARRWRLFAVVNAVSSLYPVTGAVLRTQAAREARFPEVGSGDDWVMGVSLAFRGRITVLEKPGRIYRRHGTSVSARWGMEHARVHARLVRDRLHADPAVPTAVRRLIPLIWLAQHGVLRLLRPVARRTPRRRREEL